MTPPVRTVLVADAGPAIGAGHVMRILTLGHELVRAGQECLLVSKDLPLPLRELASARGVRLVERSQDIASPAIWREVLGLGPDVLVLDSYAWHPGAVVEIERAGVPFVVIDDNAEVVWHRPTILLNQNLHADESMYPAIDGSAELLLGPQFALVRSEVSSLRGVPFCSRPTHSIAMVLGGSDVLNIGEALEREIRRLGLEVERSGGLASPSQPSGNPERVAKTLASCRLAVIAAGSTLWEVACLGTPSVALVVADNQERLAQASAAAGIAQVIDCRAGCDPEHVASLTKTIAAQEDLLEAMSSAGRNLIDGRGAERVADFILEVLHRA